MRRTIAIPLLIVALCLGAHHASAVDLITWGAATNITAATDVSNVGTLLDAGYVGSGVPGDQLVNGVTFKQFSSATDPYGKISVTFAGTTSAKTATPALTGDYARILQGAYYGNSTVTATSQTVTLSGLTIGHQYRVQYWVNQPAPGGNNASGAILSGLRTEGGTDRVLWGTDPSNHENGITAGQFAIGTFTAMDITNSFTYSGSPSSVRYELLNAITLFDEGVAVPEPSTWVAGAMAAAVLGWSQRRIFRRKTH